jgi:PPOX class probable F420-dependent enzyme
LDAHDGRRYAVEPPAGKIGARLGVGQGVPYHQMTDDEVWLFLAATPPHTGKLATTRADGSPHVAPIWFAVDEASVVFMTDSESLKGRNLRRDPRAALCVDDERPPFAFVILEGRVEISEDPTERLHWSTVIGGRYMGADQAEAYGARNAVPGELLVRLRPAKITSAADVAL